MTLPTTIPGGGGTTGTAGGGPSTTVTTQVNSTTPAAQTLANLAELASRVLFADKVGSIPTIQNALDSNLLSQIVLQDPAVIRAYTESVSAQMNAQSAGPKFTDLSGRIADLVIGTSAQGAGTLEVHLVDPYWVLLNYPDRQGNTFIQTDENGFLWPPIDVNFPSSTACWWRLCQVHATRSAQMSDANVILTFEDRIVSQLREMSSVTGGILQGQPGQSLSQFFQSLVTSTNQILNSNIRYLSLVSPQDPNYVAPPPLLTRTIEDVSTTIQQVVKKLQSVPSDLPTDPSGNSSIAAAEVFTAAKQRQLTELNSWEGAWGSESPPWVIGNQWVAP